MGHIKAKSNMNVYANQGRYVYIYVKLKQISTDRWT